MKTTTNNDGHDTTGQQVEKSFKKWLNDRIDERESSVAMLTTEDLEDIYSLTLDLREVELGSTEFLKITNKLKRNQRYLAVEDSWEAFLAAVRPDAMTPDDRTPIPATDLASDTATKAVDCGAVAPCAATVAQPAAKKKKTSAREQTPKQVAQESSAAKSAEGSEYWATRINQQLKTSVASLIAAGKELLEAKARLRHGEWTQMFDAGLITMSLREAQKLMQVAGHPVLSNSPNWAHLPTSHHALTALSRIPAADLEVVIKEQKVSPATTIQEAEEIAKQVLGETKATTGSGEQAPTFDVEKAVAHCFKTINKALEDAGDQHRENFVAELVAAVDALCTSQERAG
jgi:hypothetical protein